MNNRAFFILASLVLAIAAPSVAHAQAGRPYMRFDIGPAWSDKTDLDEFAQENVDGAEFKFDTGIRLGAAGGFQITEWFGAEIETGVIYNEVDVRGISSDGDLELSRVPLLVNVVFQAPGLRPVVPFVGAGIGGAASMLAVDDFTVGTTTADGYFSDFVFAWQGFAGLRFDLNENMSIGLVYKYFYSAESEWDPDLSIGTSGDIVADSIQTHSVSFVFNLQF